MSPHRRHRFTGSPEQGSAEGPTPPQPVAANDSSEAGRGVLGEETMLAGSGGCRPENGEVCCTLGMRPNLAHHLAVPAERGRARGVLQRQYSERQRTRPVPPARASSGRPGDSASSMGRLKYDQAQSESWGSTRKRRAATASGSSRASRSTATSGRTEWLAFPSSRLQPHAPGAK